MSNKEQPKVAMLDTSFLIRLWISIILYHLFPEHFSK